jgi:hypothetical protein
MTQATDARDSSDARSPDVTLDYGQEPPRYRNWWTRARADVQERIDGALEFIGAIAYALGGWRQVIFAASLACLAGGLGLSLEDGFFSTGHRWMSVGGFLLGLVLPLKKRDGKIEDRR